MVLIGIGALIAVGASAPFLLVKWKLAGVQLPPPSEEVGTSANVRLALASALEGDLRTSVRAFLPILFPQELRILRTSPSLRFSRAIAYCWMRRSRQQDGPTAWRTEALALHLASNSGPEELMSLWATYCSIEGDDDPIGRAVVVRYGTALGDLPWTHAAELVGVALSSANRGDPDCHVEWASAQATELSSRMCKKAPEACQPGPITWTARECRERRK